MFGEAVVQKSRIALFVLITAAAAGAACGPRIGVRENGPRSQPLWEPALYGSDESVWMETPQGAPAEAPRYGLAALEKQVLGVMPTGPDLAMLRPAADVFAADDEDPLPAELVSLAATRFAVESAGAACRDRPLPNRTLSTREMEQFGRTVRAVTLRAYQDPKHLDIDRLNRIAAFVETGRINWDGLAWSYFTAHDRGRFANRNGGRLWKPSIGPAIPDETIRAAITVGLEAIHDYALLSCGRRAPIAVEAPKDHPAGKPGPNCGGGCGSPIGSATSFRGRTRPRAPIRTSG